MTTVKPASATEGKPTSHGLDPRVRWLLVLLFVALSLWMISPIATSCYVEAYVARLQSMAIIGQHGQLALDDQAYPINSELLYVTRLGMVWLLRFAMELLRSSQLWVLRLVTIASFLLLTGSSVVFVRRWGAVPGWAVLACVVLTPGILEPSFFFADNLVSASLTTLAFALIDRRVKFPRWFGIGMLLACAMLIRLDAVLVMPAVLAVLWLACRDIRKTALATAFAVLGASVLFLISYKVTGVSLLLAYRVGRFFTLVNNNPEIYQTGLRKTMELIFFGFFGLITLPLLAIGVRENFRVHGRRWSFVMSLCPLLFYLIVIPRANEIRDFCLLGSPFVLLHAATGLRRLLSMAEEPWGRRRCAAVVLLAGFVVVFVAPPYLSMRDGPRAITGRIYSPLFWRQWQGRTLSMIDQIKQVVAAVRPGQRILVINTQFEPDRYLHLRLLQEGFQIDSAANGTPECASIESFHRNGRTVLSIRTDSPFGIVRGVPNLEYVEALQVERSLACLHGQSFARTYLFSIGASGQDYAPGFSGPEVRLGEWLPMPMLHYATYGFFGLARLSSGEVEKLELGAKKAMEEDAKRIGHAPLSYVDFRNLVQPRYWKPH